METFHFNIPLSFEVYGDKAPEVDNKDNTDVKPADVDVKTVNTEDQPIVKKGDPSLRRDLLIFHRDIIFQCKHSYR